MIFAEKIIKLRKQQGWSQEELAIRLNVSRQSVSKWESMASLPDLDKILKMSELFGVSTDYLLKDEAPAEEGFINEAYDTKSSIHTVSLEEANTYLDTAASAASKIANGISLCILSPVFLIIFTAAASNGRILLPADAASSIGVGVLLVIVAVAVALIVSNAIRLSRYEYLEKEPISTEYGVAGMVESRREAYEKVYKRLLVLGITLCILGALPAVIAGAAEDDLLISIAVACIFPLVGVGVNLIVRTASIWGSYQKLLEEGDFTREKKAEEKRNEAFTVFYWCLVLAVYLGVSFVSKRWDSTWVIWPTMSVFFGAALALKKMLGKKN